MRAFTLIETIVYIALLAFLLTAAVRTTYTLATNSALVDTSTATHDEGNFVVRKLDWALGSMKTITSPTSGTASSLTITRADGTQVDVRLSGGQIQMREGGASGTYTALTTSNVTVSSLSFMYLSGTPAGIEASTTINGVTFMTRRYLPY